MVWEGISFGTHSDLHVFRREVLTGVRYRVEILDQYVLPYATAICNYFFLILENARPHWTLFIEDDFEGYGLERMEYAAPFSDTNPIEGVWDTLVDTCSFKSFSKVLIVYETRFTPCLVFASHFGLQQLNWQHGTLVTTLLCSWGWIYSC